MPGNDLNINPLTQLHIDNQHFKPYEQRIQKDCYKQASDVKLTLPKLNYIYTYYVNTLFKAHLKQYVGVVYAGVYVTGIRFLPPFLSFTGAFT